MSLKERLKRVVDVKMIPARLTFFLADGYSGAITPFVNVFYTSIGFTATQAGIIRGTSLAVSSVCNPAWGALADATGHRKLIFIILCLGTAITVFSMPWVGFALTRTVAVEYENSTQNVTELNARQQLRPFSTSLAFYVLLTLNTVSWIFFTSTRCYIDGVVTNVINTGKSQRSYGNQRIFSSLGFASVNFLTGEACDNYNQNGLSPYSPMFYTFLPCIIILIPIGYMLINQGKWEEDSYSNNKLKYDRRWYVGATSVMKMIVSTFKDLDILIFFLSVIVSGITVNIFYGFFFLLMRDELHATNTNMTLTVVVGVLSEMVAYMFAKKIIKFCRRELCALAIGIFSFVPQYLIISYATTPWHTVVIQPMYGLGVGLSWSAAIDYTYKVFPVEVRSTAVTLMSSVHFIASNAIANFIGGVLYDKHGGRALFRGSGIIAGSWCIFLALFFGIKHLVRRYYAQTVRVETGLYLLRDSNSL